MSKTYLGVDIGGTAVKLGLVDENGRVLRRAERSVSFDGYKTPILDTVQTAIHEFLTADAPRLEGIAVSATGQIDSRRGVVAGTCGNFPGWIGVDIKGTLERAFGLPVTVANDANCMLLGEVWAGAAKGYTDVIGVTLGTGVGSGIIINSKIYNGYGFAGGEFGHSVICLNGRQCTCGRKGCIDIYCSATGLILTTKEQMNKNPDSLMWKLCDGDIDKVDGRTCFDAAAQGDKAGQAAVEEYTGVLSEVIVNAVNTLQPEIICLGGGVSKQGENLLRPIREHMNRFCFDRFSQNRTEVRIAELGNDAGVIGAALIGLQA